MNHQGRALVIVRQSRYLIVLLQYHEPCNVVALLLKRTKSVAHDDAAR